jgi:hypothetical protein
MICADLLAGTSLENKNPECRLLVFSIRVRNSRLEFKVTQLPRIVVTVYPFAAVQAFPGGHFKVSAPCCFSNREAGLAYEFAPLKFCKLLKAGYLLGSF